MNRDIKPLTSAKLGSERGALHIIALVVAALLVILVLFVGATYTRARTTEIALEDAYNRIDRLEKRIDVLERGAILNRPQK